MGAFLDVFGDGDIRPLDAPGVCVVCNATPDQSVEKIINTGRMLPRRPESALAGRIYVCGACASDLGKAVGLIDPEDHNFIVEAHESVSKQLAEAEDRIKSFTALEAALATLAVPVPAAAPVGPVDPVDPSTEVKTDANAS